MKTIAYVRNGYSRPELLTLEYLSRREGYRIVRLASSADVVSLMNDRHEVEEGGRTVRYRLQDVHFYSHGVPGAIRLDYDGEDDVTLSGSEVGSIAGDAFLESGVIYSYACRTGVSNSSESFSSDADAGLDTSLAQQMADHFRVPVHAFLTRSTYRNVLRNPTDSSRIATAIQTGRAGHEGEIIAIPPEHEALPHAGLADDFWDGSISEGTSEYSLWRKGGGMALPVSGDSPTGLSLGLHTFQPR